MLSVGYLGSTDELEIEVHTCTKCHTTFPNLVRFPPVYSFGDPAGKEIMVVGLNPGSKEFDGYLSVSSDLNERRRSQLSYFERVSYSYFENLSWFFGGGVEYRNLVLKTKIGWERNPYDRIGVLDIVKCATKNGEGGQWTKLKRSNRSKIIKNCEGYLEEQLLKYRPKIIIPYGADVRDWFKQYTGPLEDFGAFSGLMEGYSFKGVAIPQRQGPHSRPEVIWVQQRLLEIL
jgi:uracil-DNA glycosylase